MLDRMRGVFPPIPTPFDDRGAVDAGKLRSNIERWNDQPLAGLVVGGSNGEFPLLTHPERIKVVEWSAQALAPGRLLIGGAGAESTSGTIDLCRAMADVGAEAALVVTPHYYKSQMTGEALAEHFRRVADASPIPVLVYNVPANTGLNMPLASVLSLVAHGNIAGIKDSSGNVVQIGRLAAADPDKFVVLAGSGGYFLPALSVGAVGCVAALANIAGAQLNEIQSAFASGNLAAAGRLQTRLMALNHAVTAAWGVPGLKAAMDLLGAEGGPVRPPLQLLPAAQVDELAAMMRQVGLLVAN